MGKIVITGTGRCGTSFLMHLFTALGFNTGYNLDECEQHLKRSGCDGGIEHSIGTELFDKSDIVKNPEWLYKPELLEGKIDTMIIPVRPLIDVAKSRELVGSDKYGGFWQGATDQNSQIQIDQIAFYDFIHRQSLLNYNIVFLMFPYLTKDAHYLWAKLFLDNNISFPYKIKIDEFIETFNQIANPEKVHI